MRIRFFILLVISGLCLVFPQSSKLQARNHTTETVRETVCCELTSKSSASDSLEFAGLAAALGVIFSQDKIASILSKLPPKCKIFGYDIGEYSGDDGMDIVLSVMPDEGARRTVEVFFFLNDGPGFRLLRTLQRKYILEPIEVGFSIDQGVCHVTEKTGEFAWRITGYSAAGGTFHRVSEWTTDRMRTGGRETGVGYEHTYSYESLLSDEHYYGTNSNRSFIRQKYYDLPIYPAELSLPDEMPNVIGDSSGLMIVRGGSSWYGPDDCSVFCSAVYDSSTVTFNLRVHDDRLLYNNVADSADYLDLSFDLSRRNRVRPDGTHQQFSPNTQFTIRIIMGDGANRTPVVELLGESIAKRTGDAVRISILRDESEYQTYSFAVRVPLTLFADQDRLPSAGFVCAYHDVDHPAQLQWVSVSASAREYTPDKPETFGRLHFVSDPVGEHEWENVRIIALSEQLKQAGILP
ncbi:MAG: hypothetical protein WBQ23_11125 [Bacteroidota bacterium]